MSDAGGDMEILVEFSPHFCVSVCFRLAESMDFQSSVSSKS